MALDTVRDLVRSSLLLSGAMNVGEDPDDDEYNDALDALNSMLDSWNLEQLLQPYVASAQYLTVAGQANYAVGPGGDWSGVRPIQIREAWYIRGGLTLPLEQLEFDQYGNIPVKSVTSTNPASFMYNPSFPQAFIALYPVPSEVVTIVLSYDAVFASVTLDTAVNTLAPGFLHAFRYNLAILIPAEYGKAVPSDVAKEAMRAKAAIKSSNLKALDAVLDYNLPGMKQRGFDYRIG